MLILGDPLLKLGILIMEPVILIFETLGYALNGDITLNFTLFIEPDACLKFSELGLFALSESALGGSFVVQN